MKYLAQLLLISAVLTSCNSAKQISQTDKDQTVDIISVEERNNSKEIKNDNRILFETEKIKKYKGSNTILHDIIHTKLELSFNYHKEEVYGKAQITLKPYYYSSDTLILDAQKFIIHNVELITNTNKQKLFYTYDESKLRIQLDKTYARDDSFSVKIDYTARPNQVSNGGSWAIRSNKGLYFIDSKSDNPQIWTQGETQSNSAWFPTIDSPNQNMTQEILLTVNQEFVTLSNGVLLSSLLNNDGTRTDHWKQDKPHAPYLAMIAVGRFEIIKDYWRDMPVYVYAKKEHTEKAKALFEKTYKMIDFFSDKLDYSYPWEKYHQIIVKDFVSGAMENTGAVVFGEYVLGYSNEEQRINYESVVAHELAHHWFGDLVTCESWANLPLNESFATYFEYIWLEHEYGRYTADKHLENDYLTYSFERLFKDEYLIRFYNKHRDNMFDAHSYQKGSLILHMLRYTVGDEAFWDALELYLNQNEYQAVEIHHLRLAFEEVTGQDLNWFFNQWFLNKGIPELQIKYDYDSINSKIVVETDQIQNLTNAPLYRIPTMIDIYFNDTTIRKKIIIDDKKEKFTFSSTIEPLFINFDPQNTILCKKWEEYDTKEYIHILDKAPLYKDKKEAFKKLNNYKDPQLDTVYLKLTHHDEWEIRYKALTKLKINESDSLFNQYIKRLTDMSKNDPHQKIRNYAKDILPE